ncbi:MAG: TlpA family protein disulfide reductase [Candidatus Eremiobacteraeota bacterium]|nr:TlpA family protein disulfide reductase [Candidatus Eremiobacteraeota bacterium]
MGALPKWLYWLAGGAIVIVVLGAYFQNGTAARSGPAALVGETAPSFPATDLAGKADGLARFHGHIVVMNLWASWCPPCRAEMPELQRFYAAYESRNVVVLGVNQGESLARARAFAASLDLHFPILLDPQQQYGRVYAALGMPTTIVIDSSGTVVRGFDGPLTYEQMVAAVKPLLAPK